MIIQTDNDNLKSCLSDLELMGFVINSCNEDFTEVVLQKDDIQIDVTDLKNYKPIKN